MCLMASRFGEAKPLFLLVFIETVNIFVNPIAGRGRGRSIAERLQRRLQDEGYRAQVYFNSPESLTADDVRDSIRAVVVIGGDGTVRAVADRFLALCGKTPPLLAIPLGTANLMTLHLKLRWIDATLEADVSAAIRELATVEVDAWRANGMLFLDLASVGYDAMVVHELMRVRNGPIRKISYLWPAAIAFWKYQFTPMRVVVDGKEIFAGVPALAFAGNISEYGAGFPILAKACSNDGMLDVCVLPARSRSELIGLFLRALIGMHTAKRGAVYLRGKSIQIETTRPAPVQVDGDAAGFTPLDIRLLPAPLPFIVRSLP